MTSAQAYAAMVDEYNEWRARNESESPDRWGTQRTTARFSMDPRRPLSSDLETIAAYLAPDDVLLDVGGGAGRLGLPLALRCKEVINVDASPGMLAAFREVATAAGIPNVRAVQSDWLKAGGVEGDVCLCSSVTYFIREIEEFVGRLNRAARKRVIIRVVSLPNPNATEPFYKLLYQKPFSPAPGFRELLPVIWDLGMLPDVRVSSTPASVIPQPTRENAIEEQVTAPWVRPDDRDRARDLFTAHFDELFGAIPSGFVPRVLAEARDVLIIWETGRHRT